MTVSEHMIWTQVTRCALWTTSAIVPGDVYALAIDGVGYSHTAAPGDTAPDVASALVSDIGLRATQVGPAVDIAEAPPGVPSVVTAGPSFTVSVYDTGIAAELKGALRIVGPELDTQLRGWLAAACALADQYLQQDYDSLGDIPTPVRLGVYQAVRVFRESLDQFEGLTASRNQDRSESYADAYQGDRARRAGEALWYPFAASPELLRGPR